LSSKLTSSARTSVELEEVAATVGAALAFPLLEFSLASVLAE
jgi:hypothetical protein